MQHAKQLLLITTLNYAMQVGMLNYTMQVGDFLVSALEVRQQQQHEKSVLCNAKQTTLCNT